MTQSLGTIICYALWAYWGYKPTEYQDTQCFIVSGITDERFIYKKNSQLVVLHHTWMVECSFDAMMRSIYHLHFLSLGATVVELFHENCVGQPCVLGRPVLRGSAPPGPKATMKFNEKNGNLSNTYMTATLAKLATVIIML